MPYTEEQEQEAGVRDGSYSDWIRRYVQFQRMESREEMLHRLSTTENERTCRLPPFHLTHWSFYQLLKLPL